MRHPPERGPGLLLSWRANELGLRPPGGTRASPSPPEYPDSGSPLKRIPGIPHKKIPDDSSRAVDPESISGFTLNPKPRFDEGVMADRQQRQQLSSPAAVKRKYRSLSSVTYRRTDGQTDRQKKRPSPSRLEISLNFFLFLLKKKQKRITRL